MGKLLLKVFMQMKRNEKYRTEAKQPINPKNYKTNNYKP